MDRSIRKLLYPIWRFPIDTALNMGQYLTFRVQKTGLSGGSAYYVVCLQDVGAREWDIETGDPRHDEEGNLIIRHAEAIGETIDEALINALTTVAMYIEDVPTESLEVPPDIPEIEEEEPLTTGAYFTEDMVDELDQSGLEVEKLKNNHLAAYFKDYRDARVASALQGDDVQSALWELLQLIRNKFDMEEGDWTGIYEIAASLIYWRREWFNELDILDQEAES